MLAQCSRAARPTDGHPARHGKWTRPKRALTGLGISVILVSCSWSALRAQSTPDTATLSVFNHPVITFRASLGARSARDRASAGAERLSNALERRNTAITIRTVREGVVVWAGDKPAFTVTPADVDTLAGETFDETVRQSVQRARTALAAGAEQHSPAAILRGLLVSVLASIVFLVLLKLLRVGRHALQRRTLRASRAGLRQLSVAGYKLIDSDRVLALARRAVEFLTWGAALFLAYLWLTLILTQFAYSRPWGQALGHYLAVTLTGILITAVHAVPGLFTVVIIVVLTRFLTRLLATLFDAVEARNIQVQWLHPDTVAPTRRITVALLWLFAIAAAYPYLPGSDTAVFKGVSVFAGLIITLGSTGVVGQAMSGLVLMYSRSLKIGEYVRIGDTEGSVVDLGLLATKIRTPKGELVTIPNVVVVGASTKNFSRADEYGDVLLYTSVTIGYDAPWRQVHALLVQAAARTDGVKRQPEPFVMQIALSDFYVEYQLNVYVERPERRMSILAALHENIQDGFNEAGVQIMSPHFRQQPDHPVTVPRDRWYPPGPAEPER